jgi:phage replication initiation protein
LGVLAGLDDRWGDVPAVLRVLRDDLGGHVTRLDVAWDDKTGVLDLDVMERAVEAGHFTSRWRGGHTWKGWGANAGGRTLYFGSSRSDSMLRCYDKRAERLNKGLDVEEEHWVRVEAQFRRKRADAVAELFEGVNERPRRVFAKLAGILRGYIEFKMPNATDSNKRRWEPAGWWLTFLGHVEKARLTLEKVVRTIHHVMDWVSAQVAPSLALLEEALGSDRAWAFLFAEAQEGRSRWGPKHRAILAASRGAFSVAESDLTSADLDALTTV